MRGCPLSLPSATLRALVSGAVANLDSPLPLPGADRPPAWLVLADGTAFSGRSLGAEGEAGGEVVFNTAMTGYQEVLTDPSYRGQMVAMTYPLMGNTGVNEEDVESSRPWLAGFIVRQAAHRSSNWRATRSLHDYLADHGVVAIEGIDTRRLVGHLRDRGCQMGVISTRESAMARLRARARALAPIEGRDLAAEVTCTAPYGWREGAWGIEGGFGAAPPSRFRVAALDLGVKRNILRLLVAAGCAVRVYPASATAADLLADDPDGLFLSNGPGDPRAVAGAVARVRKLIGERPLFGICLGHQIIGLALGGEIVKLPFGHHGANHPVLDLATRKVEITSQNHNFAIDPASIRAAGEQVEVSHVNLNDQTCEGLRHKELPLFTVQYHPEASPGPHDARYLFGRFTALMAKFRGQGSGK
ncbi:MAG TPA: carbamoyl phosphate synthase small subunit [Proteobacteria bacterium]|nr:carbamoyl phosphate synthase small subunit [Pseudomonadota bacterium]